MPDSEMADLVRWLATLEAALAATERPMIDRIQPNYSDRGPAGQRGSTARS